MYSVLLIIIIIYLFIYFYNNYNAGNNKVTREYMKGINAHTELHYYIN